MSGQTICRLAERAADATDPETALATLTELRREVDEFERQQVARALSAGRSFKTIAQSLGVSRQAVHRRYGDLTRRRRLSGMQPSPELRLAIEYAKSEAQTLGAPGVAAWHLVLGILRAGDRRGAAALASAGAEMDKLRRPLAPAPDAAALGNGSGLRAVLAHSVKLAKHRGDERIEVEDVLRAALADDAHDVREALARHGIASTRVLETLDEMPVDDPDCRDA